jgi:hypothetical protein
MISNVKSIATKYKPTTNNIQMRMKLLPSSTCAQAIISSNLVDDGVDTAWM